MSINLSKTGQAGNVVSDMMFGANVLFQINTMGDGFRQTMRDFNLTAIRWPGGAISEGYFDPSNPDVPLPVSRSLNNPQPFGDTVLTFSETMAWAAETGTALNITIPTQHILRSGTIDRAALSDITNFVKEALQPGGRYADARINSFDVGNEYWGTWMTASQYGEVANHVIKAIHKGIVESGASYSPDILAQVGSPWSVDFKEGGKHYGSDMSWGQKLEVPNQEIIDQLDAAARSMITGLVSHYYFDDDGREGSVSEWSEGKMSAVWKKNGMDLPTHLTEWNVHRVQEGKPNFAMAGFMIEQFESMIRLGVENAFVWPINQRTANDLAGPSDNDPGRLSANGAAFKLMSGNLTGMRLQELNIEKHSDIRSSFYVKSGAAVLFVSENAGGQYSRSFDLSSVAPERTHSDAVLRITHHSIVRDPSMDQYVGRDAGAKIVTVMSSGASSLKDLRIDLKPYEVSMVRMEWVRGGDASAPIIGSGSSDLLIADLVGQLIEGRGGNDTIIGSSGNDTLLGGTGDDFIFGGAGGDRIEGGGGNDFLIGGRGDDTIFGGAGNDTIHGGEGNDLIYGGDGDDVIYGGPGHDTIHGGSGRDLIITGSGDNEIHLGSGRNIVIAGPGDNRIIGTTGSDTVIGGSGDDVVYAGNGGSTVYGGSGNDLIYGGAGNDLLIGGPGDDYIVGGGGNDTLIGGNGHDTLIGGAGDDVFIFGRGAHRDGGAGTSVVWGGAGADTFVFGGNAGEVTIKDYRPGVDRLSFVDSDVSSRRDLVMESSDDGVVITYHSGKVVLEGIDIVDLGSQNFIF